MEDISFKELVKALKNEDGRKIVANYGLDPKLGKYHRTYCDACNSTIQTKEPVEVCPYCGSSKVTFGVFDRIELIKDKKESVSPKSRPDYIYQTPLGFVPGLGNKTIEKLLVKTYDILYWEIDAPVSKHHMVITDPTIENLKALFYKEGLEGLKNIEFISAAYITDSGDIFGVDDIDNKGLRQSNHKIIVVQGFSVYDLIKQNHMQTYNSYEILKKQIVSDLSTVKLIRTLAITD